MTGVLFACALLSLAASPARSGTTAPDKLEHPGEVALVEGPDGWAYQHFPSNLRLYVFDKDPAGKSTCNVGCSEAWPPLIAPDDAPLVGDWTKVVREDGRKQWAYKGHPVYLRYHDSPVVSTGNGVDGVWHFLEP